jgi:hypothetical protein
MPSQNNSGQQFQRQFGVTVEATADLARGRFVAYDGGYATAAGGVKDSQGVSQSAALTGQAVTLTTSYSELVECSAAIAFGDYVKPATDSTGRAAVGTATEHCGRALGATTAAGQFVEVQIVTHRRT